MSRKKRTRPTEQLQMALHRIRAIADTIDRIEKQPELALAKFASLQLDQLANACDDAQAALINLREGMAAL